MSSFSSFVSDMFGVAGRLGVTGAEMLGDRLELAALELREAKIHFIQILILACVATALCLFGLGLLLLAATLALPPEWRIQGLAAMAGLSLLIGLGAFLSLSRRISRRPMAFAQTLAELEKDKACF